MAPVFQEAYSLVSKQNLNFQKPYYGNKDDSKRKRDGLVT